MTSHRTIFLTLTLLAVLMSGAPSSAFANPLLSGYGGPGEGNQAILGSALLGGGGNAGGDSGSSGPTGSSSNGAIGTGRQAGGGNAASTGSSGRSATTRGRGGHRADGEPGARSGNGKASGGAARAYSVMSRDVASLMSRDITEYARAGASEPLGLSGEDLGYVLLALGGLALTGLVTRRLARTTQQEGAQ